MHTSTKAQEFHLIQSIPHSYVTVILQEIVTITQMPGKIHPLTLGYDLPQPNRTLTVKCDLDYHKNLMISSKARVLSCDQILCNLVK